MKRRPSLLLGWLMLAIFALAACDNSGSPTPPAPTPPPLNSVAANASISPGLATPRPATPALPTNPPSPVTPTAAPRSLTPTSTIYPVSSSSPAPAAASPTVTPTATLVVEGLARLVLQPSETPAGLALDPTRSGEQSNEAVADGDDTRMQQLKSWGRQTGYVAVYQAASPVPSGTISLLSSSVALFVTPAGAGAAWTDAVTRLKAGLPLNEVSAAPHYGTQSVALAYTDPSTGVVTVVLVFANQQAVAEITAVGAQISSASIYPLAQIVAARLAAANK